MSQGPLLPTGSNPFAEQVNPYAAPAAEGYLPPYAVVAAEPFAGLWRQGNLLVMHKNAPLPNFCLKSNEPTTRRLKRSLTWHHPAIYLIILLHLFIYVIVAMIVRKSATIHIPLTDEWFKRRRRRMLFAWGTILLCIMLFGVAVAYADQAPWAPIVMILAVVLSLAAAIYGLVACRMVWPKRMTDQYIWLKGVHPEFLNRLEAWQWTI